MEISFVDAEEQWTVDPEVGARAGSNPTGSGTLQFVAAGLVRDRVSVSPVSGLQDEALGAWDKPDSRGHVTILSKTRGKIFTTIKCKQMSLQ